MDFARKWGLSMLDTDELFSPEYQRPTVTVGNDHPTQKSQPVITDPPTAEAINVQDEAQRYGTGRPRREIIRTKVAE